MLWGSINRDENSGSRQRTMKGAKAVANCLDNVILVDIVMVSERATTELKSCEVCLECGQAFTTKIGLSQSLSCKSDESLGHILQRCHQTDHTRTTKHDNILEHLKKITKVGWQVVREPHFKTSNGTRIPKLVITREHQALILDVQVIRMRMPLSDAHDVKRNKYTIPDLIMQIPHHPIVSRVSLNYHRVWGTQSIGLLKGIGLDAQDFKLMTIKCLQGGLHDF